MTDTKATIMRLFYAKSRLVCQVGSENTRLMRANGTVMAQVHVSATLLQVDGANTVMAVQADGRRACDAYSPYGFSSARNNLAMVGFTGERRDTQTGYYPLGHGHRLFSPALRRFIGPDELSPFASGGLNAYAYCAGDPINYSDPSGRLRMPSVSGVGKFFGVVEKTGATALLKSNDLPKSLKPFVQHFAQSAGDVNALLAKPDGGDYVSMKLLKAGGKVSLGQVEAGFFEDFHPTELVISSKTGHIIAVDKEILPKGIKGYGYRSFGPNDPSPFSDPVEPPPPPYDPPPSFETLSFDVPPPPYAGPSAQVPSIRQ
ncbi:RHS repeat-associated core domain-containing protein [Pseudomonas sp. NY11955]|uniref:RHS repeat-associated core domain-containing protein n=1 Tax=Pseudomonas sp. NY11955 TaxID=3400363 RepID=UPI003A8B240E